MKTLDIRSTENNTANRNKQAAELNSSSDSIGQLLLFLVLVFSILNIIGWIFDIPLFKSVHPQGTPMRVITTICFILYVFALGMLQTEVKLKSLVVIISGSLIAMAGTLTFGNYLFLMITGNESSLVSFPLTGSFLNPEDRMAVITSILFILSGISLIYLSGNEPGSAGIAHGLTLPIFIIAYFIPLGFIMGITTIFSISQIGVSILTGINFCLLSFAVFLFYPGTWFMKVFYEKYAGGNMARKMIPGIIIGPLIITWLRFNGEKAGLFSPDIGIVLIGVTYTFFFIILVWIAAKSVNKLDEKRNEIKENLRRSEDDYRQLVESANSIIIRWDVKGRFKFVNDYAVKFFGYGKKEEMVGKEVTMIMPESTGHDLSVLLNNILLYPDTYIGIENENVTKNGELVWISWANRPIYDESGNIQEILSIGNDYTEQRRLEEQFRTLVTASSELQYRMNPDWTEMRQLRSQGFLSNTESPNPKWLEEYILPEDQQLVTGAIRESIRTKSIFELEHRVRSKDGGIGWTFSRAVPLLDKNGQIIEWFGAANDITERKRAEEDIRRSEAILNQAGMIANLGVWEIKFVQWDDINKNPLYWSDQTYRIFGYTPGSINVTNEVFYGLVHPDDRKRLSDAITNAIAERSNYRIEHRIIRIDGVERIVIENAEISFDITGKPLRIIGAVQDITEQKLVEQKLIEAKEKAEESDRLKSAFIANLSHEIRTPMNGILGFAELLNKRDLSEESQKMYIDAISSSGKRMLDIIFDLIDISKLEAGQMDIKIEIIDLNKVLDELFIFFLPEANKKGVMLKFNKELPPDRILIETDKTKLMQILTNLVKNALKFTSAGYVEIGCKYQNNHYLFYVKDTGIGIRKEFHKQIFERFRQADVSSSGIIEGTGLGLAISKAYVELLGGTISVESEPSAGSLFSFTLPYKEVRIDKPEEKLEQDAESKASSDGIDCSVILVAEDDETIYFYLQQLLMINSIETIHARNGYEAVEIVKSNDNIDLILMDIKMPRMDGLQATREIKAIKPGIPVIAQSAFTTEEDIQSAYDAGCDDYICKPFDSKTLLKKIAKHCNAH